MQHGLILTLGGIESWIVIALLLAPAIAGWIKKAKKDQQKQREIDEGGASMELEQMAAKRREQLRQASQQRAQANLSGGSASGSHTSGGGASPGNMTMAERIARARAKAQYEQRAQGSSSTSPKAGSADPQAPNEAQRRALEQRQAELQRRREAAARQQQKAQQQAQAQQRAQQARQQQAQAHSRAQARARQRGRLIHEEVAVPEPTSSSPRRLVYSKPEKRQRPAEPVADNGAVSVLGAKMTRDELRRAIVMNEVLSKPIALRDTDNW